MILTIGVFYKECFLFVFLSPSVSLSRWITRTNFRPMVDYAVHFLKQQDVGPSCVLGLGKRLACSANWCVLRKVYIDKAGQYKDRCRDTYIMLLLQFAVDDVWCQGDSWLGGVYKQCF